MTHHQRAVWIKRVFMLLLAAAIIAGAWFYQRDPAVAAPPPEADASIDYVLELVHFHEPGHPESEPVAASLNRIAEKYHKEVFVTRIDLTKDPTAGKRHGVNGASHVVFLAKDQKVFEFSGLWDYPAIERKVDEVLRGLERVGKDWLPDVKGMQRGAAPPRPATVEGR
jgi:hypothetical protein